MNQLKPMSVDEAIEILEHYDSEHYTPQHRQAHRMAIEAMKRDVKTNLDAVRTMDSRELAALFMYADSQNLSTHICYEVCTEDHCDSDCVAATEKWLLRPVDDDYLMEVCGYGQQGENNGRLAI